jgi:hypothetical protein
MFCKLKMSGAEALHVFVTWEMDDFWEPGKAALFHSCSKLGLKSYTIDGVRYCSLYDFCRPLDHNWVREQLESISDSAALQRFDLHKEFAEYFQGQVELYCELLYGRSYSAIYTLESMLPFNLLLSVIYNEKMPHEIRSRFVKLINRLWVDRFPHEPDCGKQSLPELIWVVSDLEDLTIDHPQALPHFELTSSTSTSASSSALPGEEGGGRSGKDAFYTIASADKFQMLTKFITHFFDGVDRQEGWNIAENRTIGEVVDLMASLMSFGFFPNYDDVALVIKCTMRLLDGRRDLMERTDPLPELHSYLPAAGAGGGLSGLPGIDFSGMPGIDGLPMHMPFGAGALSGGSAAVGSLARMASHGYSRVSGLVTSATGGLRSAAGTASGGLRSAAGAAGGGILNVAGGFSNAAGIAGLPLDPSQLARLDLLQATQHTVPFPTVETDQVSRYKANDHSLAIMDTKRNLIKVLLAAAKLRDQFYLSKFLYIFREYIQERDAGGHGFKKWTDKHIEKAFVSIMDDDVPENNKLNFSQLSSVPMGPLTLDLMMYENEELFEVAFKFLTRQNEDIEALLSNAKEVFLLPKNELPVFHTFELLEREVAELRQLFETAEQWALASIEGGGEGGGVLSRRAQSTEMKVAAEANFIVIDRILDNMMKFLTLPPIMDRQESLYLVDMHETLLLPLHWDLGRFDPASLSAAAASAIAAGGAGDNATTRMSLQDLASGAAFGVGASMFPGVGGSRSSVWTGGGGPAKRPGSNKTLVTVAEKSIQVLIKMATDHDDIPQVLAPQMIVLMQRYDHLPPRVQLSLLQLLVAIYRGKKAFLVKTPAELFSTMGQLLATEQTNDDVVKQVMAFFRNQLEEVDPTDRY